MADPSPAQVHQSVLRPLLDSDCAQLLAWRNEPFIVQRSLSQRTVAAGEHRRWFGALRQRQGHDILAWIIETQGQRLGHARAELRGTDWVLTIYLAEGGTGRGLGLEAIRQACALCAQARAGTAVIAEVLPHNKPAQAAFARAGFIAQASRPQDGHVTMVWHGPGEEATTASHYRDLLAAHGDSFKTLNWGSEAGQLRRFEVLSGIGGLQHATVLDVGCGLAHFADWLESRGVRVHYTGLDLVPALLEAAARRRPGLRLVAGSILDKEVMAGERFDFVFASGIFATYHAGAEDVLRASVARMWQIASRGVAFNALSARVQDKDPAEYYADPESVLAFCRTLTPDAELVQGYHPRDFTIYLRRPAVPGPAP